MLEQKGQPFITESQKAPHHPKVRGRWMESPPQFSGLDARLASFTAWPEDTGREPRELAEAGLFHDPDDNNADRVWCK